MPALSIFAPAKLNLSLAVTGRRADGFHELLSVVAPLDFGDTLKLEPADGYSLRCDAPGIPAGGENLVLRAARVFARVMGEQGERAPGARFLLEKRMPAGAGLGGGSSDAVAALRGLNRLAGNVMGQEALAAAAAELGSDCPLFLHDGPVVIRSRGEEIVPLPSGAASRLVGRRVLVFKPAWEIATSWAYGRLAAAAAGARIPGWPAGVGTAYRDAEDAEVCLATWLADPGAPAEALPGNDLEGPAFAKFPALPVLLETLCGRFGLASRMSGSGSACFALLEESSPAGEITSVIRSAWGRSAFVISARLAGVNPH